MKKVISFLLHMMMARNVKNSHSENYHYTELINANKYE